MRKAVWIAVVVLFVLHQDFWWWEDKTLLFGFLPIGLAWHALYSLLAAGLWLAAVKYAWPDEVEAFADAEPPAAAPAKEDAA